MFYQIFFSFLFDGLTPAVNHTSTSSHTGCLSKTDVWENPNFKAGPCGKSAYQLRVIETLIAAYFINDDID